MQISTTIAQTKQVIAAQRKAEKSIGFVPTMGFLHEGHRRLIEKARAENDFVVVSIFVNPLQFGPNEDFEKYPRDIIKDTVLCESAGADLIFAPSVQEMYPTPNLVFADVATLGDTLCGANRPGHFRGVCTVVLKLFEIIKPHSAYFGEKDAQQLAIIRRMALDFNLDVRIVPCPIVRDADGLAKSSRNTYLSETERTAARIIPQSLAKAKSDLLRGEKNADVLKQSIRYSLSQEPMAHIHYVAVVDTNTLQPVQVIKDTVLIAVAVTIGKTRLIDNFTFQEETK